MLPPDFLSFCPVTSYKSLSNKSLSNKLLSNKSLSYNFGLITYNFETGMTYNFGHITYNFETGNDL